MLCLIVYVFLIKCGQLSYFLHSILNYNLVKRKTANHSANCKIV